MVPNERFDALNRQVQVLKTTLSQYFIGLFLTFEAKSLSTTLSTAFSRLEVQAPGLLEPLSLKFCMSVRVWGRITGLGSLVGEGDYII